MDYNTAIEYTHSLLRFGSRPGLERINALLCALGSPQKKLAAVHVAGTNGKGSVCVCLAKLFEQKGLKTGLFISPYIVNFRERMQINSKFISKVDYAEVASEVRKASESLDGSLHPTEFEFVTAAALLWFSKTNCDVVVLETGLGGRLDSTNVFEAPLCTVITSISTDHTAVLGDTTEKIAAAKCGIIKKGCPVVTCDSQLPEAMAVIEDTAQKLGAPLKKVKQEDINVLFDTAFGIDLVYKGISIHQPLAGSFQAENTCLAVEAAKTAFPDISDETILKGIEKVKHPARFEVVSRSPLIILDGAHNDGGARALAQSLENYFPNERFFGICGMLRDKDYEKALSRLTPLFDEIITVTPQNPRALSAGELADCLKGKVKKVYPSAVDGGLIKRAVEAANGRPIVIFGSLYLAGEIYKYFG